MDWTSITWLVLLLFFLFTEASSVNLVSVWFAAGALVALLTSLLGVDIWIQVVLFFAVSGTLLALLRPFARKYLKPRITRTNVDSVIGSMGTVTNAIDNVTAQGQVKLGAMEWTARSTSGEPIPVGTLIRADRIEGVKVFVSPVHEKTVAGH